MRKIPHGDFYCLSTGIDSVASQIETALNAFESSLSRFNKNFTKMEKEFQDLNRNLDNAKLSSCLGPTINLLKKITVSIPGTLFLEKYSSVHQKYDDMKKKFENDITIIKPQAKTARNNLKLTVSSIQKSVESLKRDSNSHSSLQKSLISFYSRFDAESAAGREIVINFCSLSTETIRQIKELVRENLEPMIDKCSLDIPKEVEDSISIIDSLIQQMQKEFNVSNVIQQFVITTLPPVLKNQVNPLQTHRMVNYFELENKLNNSGTAKLIKDYVWSSEGKEPVSLKAGETVEIISTGYSRFWKIQNSRQIFCYVPSDILQL